MIPKRLKTEKTVEKTTIWPASCQSEPGVFRAMMLAVTGDGEAKRIIRQRSSIRENPSQTAMGMKIIGSRTSLAATVRARIFLYPPIPWKVSPPPRTIRLMVVAVEETL